VVKPLGGAGGSGIIHLQKDDKNIGSVLDLLTAEGRHHIEAQAFLRDVVKGDKRVLLLDGEPIGAINRIPAQDDIRANMHVGGKATKIGVDDRDREIAAALAPELRRRGLIFVGLDVIGGYLTEVNVTSPTGLQEANRFDGGRLEALIIDKVEEKREAL
jgi:glutathione synthase